MSRFVLLALGTCALVSVCHAEPRSCSISGQDLSNWISYPPIARLARVSGVVTSRMIYAPNGKVVKVESISGPRLLSDALTGQLMGWVVKTDAIGDELCETLVIAEFRFVDSKDSLSAEKPQPSLPGILRLSVNVETVPIEVVISDPAADIAPPRGFRGFCLKTGWKLRRVFGAVFGTR